MRQGILPLLLVVVLAAGAAVLLLMQQPTQQQTDQKLFVDLSAKAHQVTRIALSNAQGRLLVAEHQGENWWLVDNDLISAYPADEQPLSRLLEDLYRAELMEAKTSRAENYHHLGVRDLTTPDSQAVLVEVSADGNTWSVLVGKAASSGKGSYVRYPDDGQSWLLDTTLNLPSSGFDWYQQPILNISQSQIARVESMGEQSWVIERNSGDDGNGYRLSSMPEGREIRYDGVLEAMISSLASLRFERVLTDQEGKAVSFPFTPQMLVVADDVGQVSVYVSETDESHFVRFVAEDPDGAPYWHELVYEISSFSAGQMTKQQEDFLQPLPEAEPEEPVSPLQNGGSAGIDEGESPY